MNHKDTQAAAPHLARLMKEHGINAYGKTSFMDLLRHLDEHLSCSHCMEETMERVRHEQELCPECQYCADMDASQASDEAYACRWKTTP